jgi:ATP-binding cassette, subfamily B, bacterial HlyB/CyaB
VSDIDSDEWLWLLGSLAQLHGVPFDASLVKNEFPPPLDKAALIRAGKRLGFELGDFALSASALNEMPLPVVAWLRTEDQSLKPALILLRQEEELLYFEAGSDAPKKVAVSEFETLFDLRVLLVKQAPPAPKDADDEAVMPAKFGFRWFLPEFLRHKRIWRDVLIASLLLQVLGLTTPLLTQVVIDKVIVHQTMSTLTVVGVGLAIALVFSAAFGWLRQYLIIHTGNRIDAVLGSTVFTHLLRLPLPFFQHRPTGVLVARLQGVETIREFLSGAAISFILDLPFMIVLLTVMFFYSWKLTLIALGLLVLLGGLSAFVTPIFRARLNEQFMAGARNQSFVTEYTAGIETVKSLQMEPKLASKYGELLADYMTAGFKTKQLANTYNTLANSLEQFKRWQSW